jgi:hypothetical protein
MTRFLLTGALGVFMYGVMVYFIYQKSLEPPPQKVDCSLAEFHPDFTPRMRELCREERKHKL